MSHLSILKPVVIFACVALITGCQKESFQQEPLDNLTANAAKNIHGKQQEHMFKGESKFATWNFIPGPGWVSPNPAPAWYIGEVEGNFNLLGKGYVNMYVNYTPGVGLQGTPAPVNLFFADKLNARGITVPDMIGTFAVSIILFDKLGNSIWAGGPITSQVVVIPPDPTTGLAKFSSTPVILGGTGKFANATGHFVASGYFDPQDYNVAGVEVSDGIIVY